MYKKLIATFLLLGIFCTIDAQQVYDSSFFTPASF